MESSIFVPNTFNLTILDADLDLPCTQLLWKSLVRHFTVHVVIYDWKYFSLHICSLGLSQEYEVDLHWPLGYVHPWRRILGCSPRSQAPGGLGFTVSQPELPTPDSSPFAGVNGLGAQGSSAQRGARSGHPFFTDCPLVPDGKVTGVGHAVPQRCRSPPAVIPEPCLPTPPSASLPVPTSAHSPGCGRVPFFLSCW